MCGWLSSFLRLKVEEMHLVLRCETETPHINLRLNNSTKYPMSPGIQNRSLEE